ncbi:tetratricopeptide repeat protein [Sinorhizobium meliloti]|uniref:Tetratricopeptide repeat protein n=1 Tax=Rhizobium meliloti TaxID=382 RepID=A0A6A7ZSX8_RHIML|nr:tetratricopeptide repeat protein [Sinorhizobium meliloti]MDW9435234.1 tetratricopeptide repeat protein [Sinorhizobium meliloti]MDW9461159.1 tetratricopeptide repeat protein [Sinorhizobium meliloti]MDW9481030.1 tetratricopeptide repeat protein [Sinorhizobium meliloti]MDW9507277.1 tetratricopeptide repeat protein [Sinorhizobium meliloti]
MQFGRHGAGNKRSVAALLALLALSSCTTTSAENEKDEPSSGQKKLLSIAESIEAKGESATALALYERAAENAPGDVSLRVRLGNARLKAGDAEGAEEAFRAALQVNPQDAEALLGLGTAQLRKGEAESAARTLVPAAQALNSVVAYNRLGTALVFSGNGAAAEEAFSKALSLQPANLDTTTNLALAQALSNDLPRAVIHMGNVVGSPLAQRRHFVNYLIVLAMAGETEKARAFDVPDMSARQKNQILAKAAKLRSISDPARRAQEVGLLTSAKDDVT